MDLTEPYHLLLVEDDHELAMMVAQFLRGEGFVIDTESNGERAAHRIMTESFDAVVLDIGLPGLDGISVCRKVRPHFEGPILILTARGDEIDEVVALEVGADDYVAKPVRPRALLARLKVHLRRLETVSTANLGMRVETSGMVIDASNRTVMIDQIPLDLTTAEFDLLWFLAQRSGQVVSREELYQELQGTRYDGLDRSMDLRVSRLRKKIGDDPNHPERIKSIRGIGYLLTAKP
ncbi:response regulator transcription factor [Novipirellula artificiosorum]|uniref:Transcriptional regulatory protein WalR n=1 Tax=Novipirellula artificiosorum TaxID=2528016 RepID=A0A5C6DQ82_9BACT|nr:response regulator transcription factor [Novipirellula artificiosorum]TWU37176.1 Transcriptional regulatory protein WalR [Novipirellula artificiosorum]